MPKPSPVLGRRFAGVWRNRGLRWGAAVAALLGCSLLAMFGLMFWRSSYLLFETLDRSVLEQVELLSARPPDMLPFMISSRMNHQPAVVTLVGLFETTGRLVVGDIAAIPRRLTLDGKIAAVAAPDDPHAHWRGAGRRLADGRILVVARPADEILEVRADLKRGAAVGIIPAILLSLVGGALVGIATERRLRRINAVAERVIDGRLSERLPGDVDGDELDRLCAIVNRMLERFEGVVLALKNVGDNIAHDLRTPLTSLRARLERSLRMAGPETELGRSVAQSIADMDRALSIVTALLRISEIRHARREAGFAVFDLAALVREAAADFQPVADATGIEMSCSAAGPAPILGDRQLLMEAVVNIVDNAVKFTPNGGHVSVALVGAPAAPVVVVSDTGPGIPNALKSAVFQRFYRSDHSRTTQGHGLGLSLVAEIAGLHRFAVVVEDNHPGCRVSLHCSI